VVESPAASTIRVTIDDLKQEVWQKEAQLETLKAEKELLEQKIKQMVGERKEVEETGHAHRAQLTMKLQSRIDGLEMQKENLCRQVKETQLISTGSRQAEVENLKSENSDMQTKLELFGAELRRLSLMFEEKEKVIIEKEELCARLEEDAQDVTLLEQRIAEQASKISSHMETIRSIDRDRKKTLQEKEALEAQIESLEQEKHELLGRVSTLGNRNEQLEVAIEENKGKIQTLEGKFISAQQYSERLQENLDIAIKEVDGQRKQIELVNADPRFVANAMVELNLMPAGVNNPAARGGHPTADVGLPIQSMS